MKMRLSDADRERLGVDGDLPVDTKGITNREAIACRRLGFATPTLLRKALVEDDPAAVTCVVWMTLRRAGVETDIETLEFDLNGLDWISDPEPAAPEGKASAPDPSGSSPRTTSKRAATSRRRSTSTE